MESYAAITCTICTRLHLVDPNTGRVLGADELQVSAFAIMAAKTLLKL
jgi:hypothetical protein